MGSSIVSGLREAKIADYWRDCYKRNYPFLLKKISFIDGTIYNGEPLSIQKGMNAIIGKNGIGKSNFMRIVYNSFASENSNKEKFNYLLDDTKILAEFDLKGYTNRLLLNPREFDDNYDEILTLIFDPCNLIPDIQKMFYAQENFEELLEAYSEIEIGKDDLQLISFLTNTEYKSIKMVNIEDDFDNFPFLPFFTVIQEDKEYDSRNMGLGEQSLLYFYWLITRIRNSELPCFLLIEEPESFIPPLIQNRLRDAFAMLAAKDAVTILVSTHSEHILKNIPKSHVHTMRRIGENMCFIPISSDVKQMNSLGLTSPKRGVILFEDVAAKLFIQSFIKASPSFMKDDFIYHTSGSDGDIIKDLERFPPTLGDLSVIAVFDGDAREKYTKQLHEFKNYIFLPKVKSPEEVLIDYIKSSEKEAIARRLIVSLGTLYAAIDTAAGADHHDYFHTLARECEKKYEEVFSSLCDAWIEDVANKADVEIFFLALYNQL